MWPSAKLSKTTQDEESAEAKGGFASFWPSLQKESQPKTKAAKKDVVLEVRDDDHSQDSDDVDWLALPVAKAKEGKLQEGESRLLNDGKGHLKQPKSNFHQPNGAESQE